MYMSAQRIIFQFGRKECGSRCGQPVRSRKPVLNRRETLSLFKEGGELSLHRAKNLQRQSKMHCIQPVRIAWSREKLLAVLRQHHTRDSPLIVPE